MEGSPRPRKPRRRWRWHVPPALVHGGESLEGVQVLDEVEGAPGLLLWETYRDVVLWGMAQPDERAGLFAPGAHEARLRAIAAAGLEEGVERSLRAASAVLADPDASDEREVMEACRQAADWAERRGLLSTAVALAAAAAVASPANAAAAYRVGQIARRRGEGARAETWFRRAIGLGRQARDWTSYAEAFNGLGNLYRERGNYPAARRLHVRGLRAARRHALREVQARTLHDLFTIALVTGPPAEAQELARLAFRAYGARNPHLPELAHDVARFWMSRGRFQPAYEVLRAVLPHRVHGADRLLCAGDLGRAAGACGDRAGFGEAWEGVWEADGEWEATPTAAPALLALAQGASSLRDWTRAERAAEAARALAVRQGGSAVAAESEAVLDGARRKRGMAAEPVADLPEDADELKADLVRSLTPR